MPKEDFTLRSPGPQIAGIDKREQEIIHDLIHFHFPPLNHGPWMSWGVYDYTTQEATNFDAYGGHFQSIDGHSYLVVVRVQDDTGVQKITLDGFGKFRCSTYPDKDGVEYEAPFPLPASIPHQEFNNTGTNPTYQVLIALMNPSIGAAFDYFKLSGGFHHYNNTPGNLEYFAFDGLMTFSAISTNLSGGESSASLTTSPKP